jgi:hypothetical protein
MGAWSQYYAKGMTGFNDPQGLGILALKTLLSKQKCGRGLDMTTQHFGSTMEQRVRDFQEKEGRLQVDGVVGPKTAAALLLAPKTRAEAIAKIPNRLVARVIDVESANDPGAFVIHADSVDRGLGQINSKQRPDVTDEQAYDPYFVVGYLARDLSEAEAILSDWDAAVVSWNVGVGGARKWLKEGKPMHLMEGDFDLGATASQYLLLVQEQIA